MALHVPALDRALEGELRRAIDAKTKPPGSLGALESLALQVALVQGRVDPVLVEPALVVFAADHGIAEEGVSAYPSEVTRQMVLNFATGGAAINAFASLAGMRLEVVDAGVRGARFAAGEATDLRVADGTRNFVREPAMSHTECARAFAAAAGVVDRLHARGSNVIGLGDMGIGNTASAALVMSLACDLPVAECVGAGTGLDDAGVARKLAILERARARVVAAGVPPQGMALLAECGGFEIAMICAAMLRAAETRMLVLVDGFIAGAALLVARQIAPAVTDYCVLCHRSAERGHALMLERLGGRALLDLRMRLGEGTGAALGYRLVEAAVAFLREMATFDGAGVSGRHP